MDREMISKLDFRRQYILSPIKIECPFQHNVKTFSNNYFLYTHIDLLITEYNCDDLFLVLLGDIFDYESPEKNNTDILKDLIHVDFEIIIKNTAKYTGRFVLIFYSGNSFNMASDATAARKIFYSKTNNGIWCASQPYLLAKVLCAEKNDDESMSRYYGSEEFQSLNNSNIGDTTCYMSIKQLLPNHFLDLTNFEVSRFWPFKKIKTIPLNEAVNIGAKMIRGFVESIAARYDLMLPVTAGKDSRLLLAATYNIRDKVFYYINKETCLNDESNDIAIPKKLLEQLNLKFNILDPYITVDREFNRIYNSNNEFASQKYFPIIYNYYKNFSDKVNLPGNFVASSLEMYGLYNRKITGNILAALNFVPNYEFARNHYQEWLNKNSKLCSDFNIQLLTLFYWEERIANWGTQVQLDKDIAQEDIVPYNSRQLIELFLSVNPKYIDRPDYILYRKIIHKLWPELLKIPYNPSLKNKTIAFFRFFGIWKTIRKVQYTVKLYSMV